MALIMTLTPPLTLPINPNPLRSQVTIYGSGEQKVQLTSVADVAAWLPDVLLDPEAAAETDLVGEVLTWNEVVATCQDATGAPQQQAIT